MNKLIPLLFAILILPFVTDAQVIDGLPYDSSVIRFTIDSTPNFIADTSSTPLWQTGRTHKSFFTTDTEAIAIMTDTVHPYHINANDWFVIKVPRGFNTIVDFWHKYQTDTGHDGGMVEFSLDAGTTWQNVKGPCNADSSFSGLSSMLTSNFYSFIDTLTTGEPSFSGTSGTLQYSRFQFFDAFPERTTSGISCSWPVDTFYVRFRFVSDSLADSLAGWEIDSIKIENDNYGSGRVTKINKPHTLSTYPNPSYDDQFTFPTIENEQNYTIEVYNAMGQKISKEKYLIQAITS